MNRAALAELDDMHADFELGERDGRAAADRIAAELFEGDEGIEQAWQCLADLADGNPQFWLLCPEPHEMHGESYIDGYGAGWASEMERQARLTVSLFANFETVPH